MNRTAAVCIWILWILASSSASARLVRGLPQTKSQAELDRATYEAWISDYCKGPLGGAFGDRHQIELRVTVIEGDDLEPDAKAASVFGSNYRISISGFAVSTEGTISTFRFTATAFQGGGPGELPREDFERIREVVKHLPSDTGKLPPAGRRIVFQTTEAGGVTARVYDRASMPDEALEILRLSNCNIRPIVLTFAPDAKGVVPPNAIGFATFAPNGEQFLTLAVSPDRKLVVRQAGYAGVTITTPGSPQPVRRLVEQPIGRRSFRLSHPRFTPDGRYLILNSDLPTLRIYDTRTWEAVGALPDLPNDAVAYFPSQDWKRGVSVNASGEIWLWEAASRHHIERLDGDGALYEAVFSPDGSLLATTSGHQNEDTSSTFHLRVWDTATGKLLNELRPFEETAHDDIGVPIWWPEDHYLLAPIRDGRSGPHDVGIWSLASGRFRAALAGCAQLGDLYADALVDDKLFERCSDGKVWSWNVTSAIEKVEQFEESLLDFR